MKVTPFFATYLPKWSCQFKRAPSSSTTSAWSSALKWRDRIFQKITFVAEQDLKFKSRSKTERMLFTWSVQLKRTAYDRLAKRLYPSASAGKGGCALQPGSGFLAAHRRTPHLCRRSPGVSVLCAAAAKLERRVGDRPESLEGLGKVCRTWVWYEISQAQDATAQYTA